MEKKNWFKEHADTLAILASFAVCFWTLTEKIDTKINQVNERLSSLEKDVTIIKTVLSMKEILPKEYVKKDEK